MKKPESLAIGIAVLSFVVAFVAYQYMPPFMASHWNAQGEVDGFMPRFWGVFLMPIISVFFLALIYFFVKADPLLRGRKEFKVYPEWIFFIMMLFLFYIYLISLAWNFGYKFNLVLLMVPAFSAFFFALGIIIESTERNYTVGIRTPWTLADDRVWAKTHALGGKLFKVIAVFSLLGLLFVKIAFWLLIIPILLAVVFLVFYSYKVYKEVMAEKSDDNVKNSGKTAEPIQTSVSSVKKVKAVKKRKRSRK